MTISRPGAVQPDRGEAGVDLACLEPWRDAVRGATDAVGLIELPSTRFIELSPRAKEMVGSDRSFGLELLADDERVEAATIAKAASAGAIAGTEARRHQWQLSDGSIVDVKVRARAIRLDGATFGVWVARVSGPAIDTISGAPADTVEWPVGDGVLALGSVATLDDGWRVRELSGEDAHLHDLLGDGVALTAITDPRDMVRLLFAFAGATTKVDASTRLRLRSAAETIPVEIEVTRVGHGSWHLGLTRVQRSKVDDHGTGQRVRALESSLQRIAREVQGTGVVRESVATVDLLRVPGISELPDRQREVVVRLARGERVGMIAAKMYLSANTVRNHLSAVFKKFGVHSQPELLALLRGEKDDESTSAT